MKNTLIAGGIAIAGIAGVMSLVGNGSSSDNVIPLRDTNYQAERSYEEYSDRDCGDFYSQAEAQRFFESEGGPYSDYHGLDRDQDGIACESL